MPFHSWRDAVLAIDRTLVPATELHKRVAAAAGVSLGEETPSLVAAAILRVQLQDQLRIRTRAELDPRSVAYATMLAESLNIPPPPMKTGEETAAWIQVFYL